MVQDDLGILRDLVALLAHDRDLTGLRHEQLAELFELGRGWVAPCEDAEVDLDLQTCGLLLDGEGDDVFDLHYKPYYRLRRELTLSRLPAESAQCNSHSEQSPAREDAYCEGPVPELLAVEIDAVDQIQEVLQREDSADRPEHLRVIARGAEGSREEGHRQHDDVEDRRRALEGADEPRDRQAERGERRGPKCKRKHEREQVARPRGRFQHAAERKEHCGQVDRRWKRRRSDPFQDPDLAAGDKRDPEPCERRVRGAVPDHPCEEAPCRRPALDVTVVDGGQQCEEQDGEEEHEHRGLAAAPEQPLLALQLMPKEPHSRYSVVSAR